LLTHSGHSYAARGADQVAAIYTESVARLQAARAHCKHDGLLLSLGDTPCCSVVDDLSACDEIRPGNFVFYDLMQLHIGSCAATDLAAATACPVIGVYPERHQLVLHGGAAHLSQESLCDAGGTACFGCLGTVTAEGLGEVLPQAPLVSLSQEHGVVEIRNHWESLAAHLVPGDLVLVWPVHSCLNCDLLRDQMSDPVTL
jgi:D-serine deaminase-like pyridoxal phosphate-dependent protein